MDLLGTASRPKGPSSSAPTKERRVDLSQNGYFLLLFFLQVKGACEAPRPIGLPLFLGLSGRALYVPVHVPSLYFFSLSLSLSLPGGESWGKSVPNPPRAGAHLRSTGVFSFPPSLCDRGLSCTREAGFPLASLSLSLLLQGMGSRLDPPAFRPPNFWGFQGVVKSGHVGRNVSVPRPTCSVLLWDTHCYLSRDAF